ncbi:MAG: hypothetical protein KDC87_09730 [Planctomycetes bacterium]|nr:hypothetical protein [Planctomycetota bacterium]
MQLTRPIAFAVLALLGCSCAVRATLPPQFLEIQATSTSLKATTASNALFWVERFDIPRQGTDLAFWVEALRTELVDNRGYTLVRTEDLTTAADAAGKVLEFSATAEGAPHGYLVALFVDRGWFRTNAWAARLTAEKAEFEKQRDAVKAALRTLRF